MPSPFPGMDPYLEGPAYFPGLHNRLISALSDALQAALPAPYFAEIGERVWVEVSNTVPHDERREPRVEIRTVGDDGEERLVTAVEILSPSNKTPGERGRDLYLRKEREILDSPVHLVELDLLRGGTHTTAVPLDRLVAAVGAFDYHASIHRADRFEEFVVYPIRLDEPLPEVAIPLLPGDGDVAVELQSLFDRAYDAGPYRRRLRYRDEAPIPPLLPDQQAWAEALLREA